MSVPESTSPSASAIAGLPAEIASQILLFTVDSRWFAARIDGSAGFEFPLDETPLTMDSSWIVSRRDSDAGDVLVVRDAETGEVRHEVQRSLHVVGSAIADGSFYWGENSRETAQDPQVTDGGVWRLLLPDGEPTAIHAPDAGAGGPVTDRGGLAVSPSGATVAATQCRGKACAAQVFDLASGADFGTVPGLVGLLSDQALVVTSGEGPFSSGPWPLAAYKFDGKVLWHLESVLIYQAYLTGDGTTLVAAYEGGSYPNYRYQVVTVDMVSGAISELYGRGASDPPWFLVADLSTDRYAVLVRDLGVSDAIHQGLRELAILDMEADSPELVVFPNVLPIGAQ